MPDWRNTPHEDAIAHGRTVAEVDAILDALNAAGLLLTDERIAQIVNAAWNGKLNVNCTLAALTEQED